jgi:hypothetical protein
MKVTTSNLIRLSGLALVPAGIVFAGIQPIHPPDVVESVTTGAWAIITSLKFAMCVLFLVGITGLYARQADKAGLFGLLAFLVLATSWTLQTPFVFTEAFVLPPLAATAPAFVDAALGISYGHTGGVDLGVLPTLYSVGVGITYMLGGLLFGIATLRAGILPRVPAALLAIAAADAAGGAAPARATAVRRHPGGISSGLAGLFALLRAPNVGLSRRACDSRCATPSGSG